VEWPQTPCEAVSLQFHRYKQWVGGFGIVPPQAADLLFDTEQLLHVMADFMGDHICPAEFARRAQAVGKFVEKPGDPDKPFRPRDNRTGP
jgi:hypothetical protein